jgi:hypothetical protein
MAQAVRKWVRVKTLGSEEKAALRLIDAGSHLWPPI